MGITEISLGAPRSEFDARSTIKIGRLSAGSENRHILIKKPRAITRRGAVEARVNHCNPPPSIGKVRS